MKCGIGRNGMKALKVILFVFGCIIVYYEWISYYVLPLWIWPSTSLLENLYPSLRVHGDRSAKEQTVLRILLVADPQIQGFRDEPAGILGAITRWDADRYLSKTYSLIYQHIDPHLVVFLGDLLDEGSIASADEYVQYADRFHRLFPVDGSQICVQAVQLRLPAYRVAVRLRIYRFFTKHLKRLMILLPGTDRFTGMVLYVAGDNDIGGEGGEAVTENNVRRFRQNFHSKMNGFWNTSVHLVEANTLLDAVPSPFIVSSPSDRRLPRVLFSHMPLLQGYNDQFVEKVLHAFQPALIISAHTHKASVSQRSLSSSAYAQVTSVHRSDYAVFQLHPNPVNVQEIVVPTCSYRMGVAEMGYGVAIVDLTNKRLFYSVYWLHSRYSQLFCELWALCAVGGFVLIFVAKQNFPVYWKPRRFFIK